MISAVSDWPDNEWNLLEYREMLAKALLLRAEDPKPVHSTKWNSVVTSLKTTIM